MYWLIKCNTLYLVSAEKKCKKYVAIANSQHWGRIMNENLSWITLRLNFNKNITLTRNRSQFQQNVITLICFLRKTSFTHTVHFLYEESPWTMALHLTVVANEQVKRSSIPRTLLMCYVMFTTVNNVSVILANALFVGFGYGGS